MPRTHDRDAASAMLPDDPRVGESEGFTVVEIIVGALIAGIFAAIVVFSIATVTHRAAAPAPKPDQKCVNEVAEVRLAIHAYQLVKNENPASLAVLVPKPLPAAPSATSPSGAAGFRYHPTTGEYTGGSCPTR